MGHEFAGKTAMLRYNGTHLLVGRDDLGAPSSPRVSLRAIPQDGVAICTIVF